jgi:hypothetical protein
MARRSTALYDLHGFSGFGCRARGQAAHADQPYRPYPHYRAHSPPRHQHVRAQRKLNHSPQPGSGRRHQPERELVTSSTATLPAWRYLISTPRSSLRAVHKKPGPQPVSRCPIGEKAGRGRWERILAPGGNVAWQGGLTSSPQRACGAPRVARVVRTSRAGLLPFQLARCSAPPALAALRVRHLTAILGAWFGRALPLPQTISAPATTPRVGPALKQASHNGGGRRAPRAQGAHP